MSRPKNILSHRIDSSGADRAFRLPSRKAAIFAAAMFATVAASQAGVILTWDNLGASPVSPANGAGTWDTTLSRWSNGTTDSIWNSGNFDTAVFGTGAGSTAFTVTLGTAAPIVAGGLIFNPGGAYTLNSGTLSLNTGSATAPVINVTTGVTAVLGTTVLSGSNGFTKLGGGTLTLRNAGLLSGTTSASTITINAGTVFLDASNAVVPAGPVIGVGTSAATSAPLSIGGATLNLGNKTNISNAQWFSGTTLTQGAGTISMVGRASGAKPQLFLSTISRNAGATVDFSPSTGNSSGAFALNVNNASGTLGGWATYLGVEWARNAGAAQNGQSTILGGATYTNTFAPTTNTDLTLSLAAGASGTTGSVRFNTLAANTLTLSGTNVIGSGGILNTSTVAANSSSITGGAFTSGTNELFIIQNDTNAAGTLAISSSIVDNAGAVALTKSGAGTVNLSGANTFSGGLYINAGIVQLGGGSALSNGLNAVSFGNNTANTSGTLQLNGNGASVASLSTANLAIGTPVVEDANAASATLNLNGSASTTYNGTLQNGSGGGALSLTKTGSGTQTLAGSNTYTGNTTVTTGNLTVKNTIASSNVISVGSGATLDVSAVSGGLTIGAGHTLTGAGTVTGAVSVSNLGIVAPGTSGVGTLTLSAVTLNDGSVLNFEFANTSSYDTINASSLTLSGTAGVNLYAVGGTTAWTTNSTYNLFNVSGAVSGTVASQLKVANAASGVTYTFGTSGSFITLNISGTAALSAVWGASNGGSWPVGGNWVGGIAPNGAGNTATFLDTAVAQAVTLDGNETVGGISLTGSTASYTISSGTGGSLILDNAGLNAAVTNAGSNTISAPVILNSNTAVNTPAASDAIQFTGAISGTGSVIKSGAGTLALTSSNSYSGGTSITAGKVQIGDGGAFGSGTIAVGGNSTLQAIANSLAVSNSAVIGNGVTATVDTQGNTLTLGGVISDTSANGILTKSGSGTLILTANNTYGGVTNITAGTLQLGNSGTSGAVAGAIVNGGALVLDRTDSFTVGGAISGTGSLSQIGGGTAILSASNSFTGPTSITNGTVQLNNANAAVNSTVADNGALTFGVTAATVGALSGSGNAFLTTTGSAAVALTTGGNNAGTTFSGSLSGLGSLVKSGTGTFILSGSSTLGGNGTVNAGELQVPTGGYFASSSLNINNASTLHVNGGNLVDSGGITLGTGGAQLLIDSGTASFASTTIGANSDGARVKINGGTVSLGNFSIGRNGSALDFTTGLVITGGATTATSLNFNTSNSWGAVSVSGGSLTVTGSNNSFLVGNGSNSGRGAGLKVTGGTLSYSGTDGAILNNSATGNVSSAEFAGGTSSFAGITLNKGAVTAGSSTLTVDGGTLYLGNVGLVGGVGTGAIPYTIALTSGTVGALADWTSSANIGISGAGITLQTADSTAAAHNITLAGTLAGSGALTQTGTGTLTISGTSAGYTGPVTVNGGTMIVSGQIAAVTTTLNDGTVLAGSGKLGDLNVTGTSGSATAGAGVDPGNAVATVSSAGIVTGNGIAGTLSVGAFNLGAGSHLSLQLGGTGAGLSDQLVTTGAVTLAGDAQIALINSYVPQNGDTLFLVLNGSGSLVTGAFSSIDGQLAAEGDLVNIGGYTFDVTYVANGDAGGTANDVALIATSVPEPATWAMLVGGLGLLVGSSKLRRRRA